MKNIYLKLILIFGLLFLHLSCSEDLVDKVKTGLIKGTVVQSKTNLPLANVKITTSPSSETVFTAADGSFTLPNTPVGDYSLKAELQGYLLGIQAVSLKNDGQTVSVVFEMKDDNSQNSPPSIPILVTPADNAVDQPLSVQLSWTCTDPDAKDILTFKLIVKNSLNATVKTVENIAEKTYTLASLNYGVNYFWQIVVSDGINPDVYSAVSQFTTNKIPANRFHYVQKISGNNVILSANETDVNFQLTSPNYNSWRPRKNNFSGLIAFLRTVGGNTQIFTVKPDGSDVFQVTSIAVTGFNLTDLDFAWSQNGKELLYANFDKLYRINKDGSGLQLVYKTTDGSLISECDWSSDGSRIAVKTNDYDGYNTKIFVINLLGNIQTTILSGVNGASGGLNFSVDGTKLLYTHDISGFQNADYRQLNTHIFLYNFSTSTTTDLSEFTSIPAGSIDIDPRFSPNEAQVIFTNTSNDGISQKSVYTIQIDDDNSRTLLFSTGEMPDWE
ncbi:carboxypeptidase regulatory-like domain-containing protein [Halpernia frigidisoli]|uniref:Carboxypeptidase regulatory-like domain-containing protein n=1 Tax=Halpernia frigidisoli TaxID=1125876 RepID=A0A1I3DJK5_9FLAO|nr:carboxypeptidase regulatory-like domain-containing protein [Halpernia frigidisoli]SFH86924.1 Carboxypeptidase regulatory-like domain-containing protein [Halpernia frigidisoli]